MKTIILSLQEYSNFVRCCKEFKIKFQQKLKDSFIEITAPVNDLELIGY
jgi:hypothetical protein